MSQSPVSISSYVRIVRENPNFRRLWMAQIVSEIGDWLYSIAIYSLLLGLTGSAQSVAVAVVLQVLPQVLISPAAGVLNDRMSRRKVMIAADVVRAVVVLGMLAAVHAQQIWAIYVLLFFETMMWGLFEPGRGAVIPSIMEGPDVLVANALSSTTWSFNLAVGASLGGLAAAFLGRDFVFLVNSGTFVLSAVLLAGMRFEEKHLEHTPAMTWKDAFDFSPVVEGIRYFRSDVCLLATLLAKCGLGLMGASWVILPVYGERIFPVTGWQLRPDQSVMLGMSILIGARGVGALVGPLVSGRWAGFDENRLRWGILGGFVASAAGYLFLGGAPTLGLACLAVVLAQSGAATVWVFSTTILQIRSEDRFRGRVFAADFAALVLSMSVVTYGAGFAVDQGIGVRTVAMVTGFIGVAPIVAWWWAQRFWKLAPVVSTTVR